MRRRWQIGLAISGGLAVLGVAASIKGGRIADRRSAELVAEHSLAETRHGALEYVSWGQGPAVLVLHGAGGGFDQGRLLAESLGGGAVRFIAVSRFGYLGSAIPSDPSTAAQAEALLDLLDHLGIKQANILAMSGGVPPALKFAEMFPDRTDRMVLLSSAPFTPFNPEDEKRPIPTWVYSALLSNDGVYWLLIKLARGRLHSAFDARPELLKNAPPEERRFVDRLITGFLPASARLAGVGNEGAAVDPAATYRLEAIIAPTLIVHARDDMLNHYAIALELSKRIPTNRLVSFEQGCHLLLGHHSLLQDQIEEFFRDDLVTGGLAHHPSDTPTDEGEGAQAE